MSEKMDKLVLPDSNGNEIEFEVVDKAVRDLFVTPKMFGAKGDGITDDTNAFYDAINYARDNNCHVFVPAGTYLITRRLGCYDGTTIIGDSVEKSTILLKREDTTIIYLFDAEDTQNVLFKNLHIKGYKTNDQPAATSGNVALYGIKFGGEHAQIEGCTFEGFTGSAVSIRNAKDVLISGCTFVDNNTNGIACTRNLDAVRIVNNYFHNNHYHNINFEDATPEYIVNDVVVSGNIIDCDEDVSKMAQWGINFAAPNMQSSDAKYNNVVVANNLIKYVAIGINMVFTKNAVLENNIISNCSNYGISMNNSAVYVGENIKVINNIIKNCDLASIIQYIHNLDYSHNTIRNTVKWGARFYYIKNSKIMNNFVDNVVFASSGTQVSYGIELILNTGDVYNVISGNLIKSGLYGINVYGSTADIDIYLIVKNNYFVKETKDNASTLQYCVCHENTLKNTIVDGNVAVGSPTMFRDRGSSTNVFQRNNQGFAN